MTTKKMILVFGLAGSSMMMGATSFTLVKSTGSVHRNLALPQEQSIILNNSLPFGGIETVERPGENPFDIDVPVSHGVGCDHQDKQCESYSQIDYL